jgi:hypothetical protein
MTMKAKSGIVASAAVALVAAALASAPAAVADPASDFLNELSTNGVSLPGKTPSQTVAAGYEACSALRSGTSILDEMSAVEQKYGISQGTLFVSAATTNLCPDFAG